MYYQIIVLIYSQNDWSAPYTAPLEGQVLQGIFSIPGSAVYLSIVTVTPVNNQRVTGEGPTLSDKHDEMWGQLAEQGLCSG